MHSVRVDRDVEMRTRDGAILRADVYRPDISTPVPAILKRTPYDKSNRRVGLLSPLEAVAHGYAFVIQDVRGRWRSEGTWNPIDWGGVERPDGYDAVEWLASEPWCDGHVGMCGSSYEAGNQLAAAKEQAPSLGAIAPAGGGIGYDGVRQSQMTLETIIIGWTAMMAVDVLQKRAADGVDISADLAKVLQVMGDAGAAAWTLPLKDLPTLRIEGVPTYAGMLDILARAAAFFGEGDDLIQVPSLINTGWYDIGAGFELFRSLRSVAGSAVARAETKTIVGPWGHNGHEWNIGEWGFGQFGSVGSAGVPADHLAFFDRHLRGDDAVELPNVKYFVMGANVWQAADDWPIPGTDVRRLFLHTAGALSEDPPAASENPDRYRYDPADPVPSFGLRVMYNGGSTVHGPFDQHRIESRDDVLVYTTAPVTSAEEISGDLTAVLWVESSAPETDFFVKVCVVDPRGVSCNIADGVGRTRYLDGWDAVHVLRPGEVTEVRIALGPTSFRLEPGWALRLQVTSSCFPHWDRNMNTGSPPGDDAVGVVASQVVYHDGVHASYVDVPFATRADTRPATIDATGTVG